MTMQKVWPENQDRPRREKERKSLSQTRPTKHYRIILSLEISVNRWLWNARSGFTVEMVNGRKNSYFLKSAFHIFILLSSYWIWILLFKEPDRTYPMLGLQYQEMNTQHLVEKRRSSGDGDLRIVKCSVGDPTHPFAISELRNPSCDVPQLHKIRQSPDREAQKLWKCSVGVALLFLTTKLEKWSQPTKDYTGKNKPKVWDLTEHFAILEP